MDMVDIEYRFGGVFEEELIRVYRIIYPAGARIILPRTAVEMKELVDFMYQYFQTSPAVPYTVEEAEDLKSAFAVRSGSTGPPGTITLSELAPTMLSAAGSPEGT